MAKYVKKQTHVDAVPYEPGMEDGFGCGKLNKCYSNNFEKCPKCELLRPYIKTPKGKHYVSPGDWIVTHADGSKEVLSAERFEREYELVKE